MINCCECFFFNAKVKNDKNILLFCRGKKKKKLNDNIYLIYLDEQKRTNVQV